jgi:hypothetical protein
MSEHVELRRLIASYWQNYRLSTGGRQERLDADNFGLLKPLGALTVDQELALDPGKMREIDEGAFAAAPRF